MLALLLALPSRPAPPTRAAVLRSAAASLAAHSLAPLAHAIPPLPLLEPPPPSQEALPPLLYTPPQVRGVSSPQQLALAEHLNRRGATFYGAYWCAYCQQQRALFGATASRILPYVECDARGYRAAACPPQVAAYPTWQLDGRFYSGLRSLSELQALSGFDAAVRFADASPPPPPRRPPPPPGGYRPAEVAEASTAAQLALARHLRASGARFYGAYWCRFCGAQREMFGAAGAEALPYVECAADGYRSAAAACGAAAVAAYPTWEIGGKVYSGLQSFETLARLSNFTAAPSIGAAADGLGIDFSAQPPPLRAGDDCTLAAGPTEGCE
ncbi:hypothetical protein AB1Y20_013274 [Prymnesium parvum]|uniref:Thioredoxin domain-containing protein n=1 Tax=Prymnesium parvum TaxID=97485 RepID=A0AB34IMV9_PRYPA